MNQWLWRIFAGLAALGVIAIIVIILLPNKPSIPLKIQKQLTFTLLLPATSQSNIGHSSVTYNGQLQLLTYNADVFAKTVTISEQPTPQTFTDIPAAYQKVLDGMNDYNDFDVNVGSVHLTTPAQLGGKQVAVLNTKGTLLFAKPASSLSNDQWRQFFTNLEVAQ